MNAVSTDVSSGKSTVTVFRPFSEVIKRPFTVGHRAAKLAALAQALRIIDGETHVVMEHTKRYYEKFAYMLYEARLFVCLVNPFLIKQYDNNILRSVKADKSDALKIVKCILDNWVDL